MADEGLYAGCARTADGLVFWEQAARGEDPGVVYAMASKAATDVLYTDPDGWTLRSGDGSRGAHMEHTIAITPDGPLVLTER